MKRDVVLPERMKKLPVDKRGFPIPVIIMRDPSGEPQFAINDTQLQTKCVRKKLCPICGERLTKDLWFVGGPKSAFEPNGAYFDSANHYECVEYALQVCPYLATTGESSLSKDPERIKRFQEKLAGTVLWDATQDPKKPRTFVLVKSFGQTIVSHGPLLAPYIQPLRPYHAVEFWRSGVRIPYAEGITIAKQVVNPKYVDDAARLIARASAL